MSTTRASVVAGFIAVALVTGSFAATLDIDVTNVEFIDFIGDPDNVIMEIDLGHPAVLTGFGFDVIQTAFGDSFGNEATILINDLDGFNQFGLLTPSLALTTSLSGGTIDGGMVIPDPVIDQHNTSGGILKLIDKRVDPLLLSSGVVRLEFFESFDDAPDAADGQYTGPSTLTLQYRHAADFNGDDCINQSDLGILLSAFGVTAAGDANNDGATDQADLGLLLAAFDPDCRR